MAHFHRFYMPQLHNLFADSKDAFLGVISAFVFLTLLALVASSLAYGPEKVNVMP